MTYQHKSAKEAKLQERVNSMNLQGTDFEALYWRLWGACSNLPQTWRIFEHLTTDYLNEIERRAKNERKML